LITFPKKKKKNFLITWCAVGNVFYFSSINHTSNHGEILTNQGGNCSSPKPLFKPFLIFLFYFCNLMKQKWGLLGTLEARDCGYFSDIQEGSQKSES